MEKTVPRKSFLFDVLLPKLEVLYVLVSILGGIMFWNHWGRGETLLLVGLGGLSVVYYLKAFEPQKAIDEINFPLQYSNNFENQFSVNETRSFLLDSLAPKVMYISSACILVGVLFKLMFWTGGNTMLIATVPLLVFFVIACALSQRINRRTVLVALIGGLMLSVSSETLMRQLYRDDPQLVEAIVNQIHHPHDRIALEAYQKQMHNYRYKR
ncbi:hypothetical protein ACVWYF_002490 [Hymenobacter sp. UYAg731]